MGSETKQTTSSSSKETCAQAKWRLEVELAFALNDLQLAVREVERVAEGLQRHFKLRTYDEITGGDEIPF